MEKHRFYLLITVILLTPGIRPTQGGPNESPVPEERLLAARSLTDSGLTYNVELYYSDVLRRIWAKVLVGDTPLRGLHNRLYCVDPNIPRSFSVTGVKQGHPVLHLDHRYVLLEESSLNTDAIYDTIEALASKPFQRFHVRYIRLSPPPGLLKRTYEALVSGDLYANVYLVTAEGQIGPYTLENLRVAYWREGIKARSPEDFDRIGRSIVNADTNSDNLTKIISDVNEIPGYSLHPLRSRVERRIRAPCLYEDTKKGTHYWTCYIYSRVGGTIACYEFGFQQGYLTLADRAVLARNIGSTIYIDGFPKSPQSFGSRQMPTISLVAQALFLSAALVFSTRVTVRTRSVLKGGLLLYSLFILWALLFCILVPELLQQLKLTGTDISNTLPEPIIVLPVVCCSWIGAFAYAALVRIVHTSVSKFLTRPEADP